MGHFGIICPNAPGHTNPMTALADSIRGRGHRVTFFLLGDAPPSVTRAGFEVVEIGGTIFPPDEYRAGLHRLGTLSGRSALKQTFAMGARAAEAILQVGPTIVESAGVTGLIVDQASYPGGTVAEQLGLPFATVCNALLLHSEPGVPPFFTPWLPRDSGWARLRNRIAWAGLDRLYSPILARIRDHRRRQNLREPGRIADTWSARLQVSQQPEVFEFPRRELPRSLRFVGPLRVPGGYPPVPFPWDRLDGRPLIFASLGTLQNRVAGDFRMIAEACAGLEVQLVLSTGRGVAPAALGELPGSPVVVDFAPQLELIRRSVLAVTHAGLNTVLDCLSEGVPMVAVPIANEQPGIAARVAWTGAGEALPLERATPEALRSTIDRVLGDPSYRLAADRIRESIRDGGGAPRAAELIEEALTPGA